MKIGILLISNGFSGAERAVHTLVENASKISKGSINLFINDEIYEHYSDLKNVKIHKIGNMIFNNILLKRGKLFFSKNIFRDALTKNKVDILNIHMFLPPEIMKIIYKSKIPYVITLHGSDIKEFKDPPSIFYKYIIKPVFNKFLDKSSKLILVGNHQLQDLPEEYKKKTVVIPNGVDSKIFKPLKNIKQKKNVILFAGRFMDIKGIREIINVAKQLPQYEFWFAGQGPLANLINLPNTKNLGFKTTEELVKLYNQAAICIAPSHRESFGLVGLEAMSCQRAIIATPLGFSEYIENDKDGIIIPAKDEKALKEAILDLMENSIKRKRLERNARKKALQYSWGKIAKQYLKVFKKVVKENSK